MAEIAVKNIATGQIEYYPDGTDVTALLREGRVQATPEDIERRQQFNKNTTTGAQAAEAGKMAANAATFGVFADQSPEAKQKVKDFSEASPTLSVVSKIAGSVAPALLAAPLASGAAAAMGLSGRAAVIGATVAEEVVGNTAYEMAEARELDRDISAANIFIGAGLGTGITMAARAVRGGAKVFGAPKAEGVLDAASSESQWLSKGRKVSGERRSVGAAGADDVRKPATAREVEAYAAAPEEFHIQVNQAGHDALTDAFTGAEGVTGRSGGAARQVHGLAFKEQDVIPHMLDVDPETALGAVYEHAESAMRAAEAIKSRSPATARRIQAQAEAALKGMDGVEETMMGARGAVGLNRLKQELDDVTNNFLQMKGVEAKTAGKELQKVANTLRANLESKDTWGTFWAERQTGENALWSGDNGIIQQSNVWQPEVFEGVKGKAWVSIDDQLSQAANRTPRADIAEHIMGLPKIKANKVLNSWESTLDSWERMTQLKEESGLVRNAIEATGESPVDVLKKSLAEQRQIIEELRFIRDAGPRAKPILDKLAASGAAKAQGELIFDGVSELPGIGSVLKAADKAKKAVTGKGIREGFMPEVLPPAREFDRAASLQAISERQASRGKRVVIEPKGPQGGPTMPPAAKPSGGKGGPIVASAAVVGAGALASGQVSATEQLAEVSDNSRAITERAALGLTVKESRAPRLAPLAERFKDGAPDLNAAFRMKTNELRQIIEDPMGYVQGMTSAFGGIAQEHPGLFQQMVQRTTVGAHYLQANLPPSVGISMIHPNGIAPDSLAVMKFAAMYNAVFSPGDVVYDVGTGDATPTQIRALREVHPDIYDNLRTDVLKQISQVGQKIPFETLRGLDNLFDLPGVAGLAFSPAMTQTMAGAYADKQTPPKQSLGGESSIAPDLASSKLAGLAAVR